MPRRNVALLKTAALGCVIVSTYMLGQCSTSFNGSGWAWIAIVFLSGLLPSAASRCFTGSGVRAARREGADRAKLAAWPFRRSVRWPMEKSHDR
jgi:hypothetical protein